MKKYCLLASLLFFGLKGEIDCELNATVNSKPDQKVVYKELFLAKNELLRAQKMLRDLYESTNPSMAKQTFEAVKTIAKECFYIAGSIAVGFGITTFIVINHDQLADDKKLNDIAGLSILFGFSFVSHTLLRSLAFLVEKLMEKNSMPTIDTIKNSLDLIKQTIEQVDYVVHNIEQIPTLKTKIIAQ